MQNQLALIQQWINESPQKVTVIHRKNHEFLCDELLGIGETSVLGTIINHVGGIQIGNFIRHFGGENVFDLSVRSVNGVENQSPTALKDVLLVAGDVYGGLYGINIAMPIAAPGTMLFLPADTYVWESMGRGHSDFVHWSLVGDLALYYKDMLDRFSISNFAFDEVCSFSPPLWCRADKHSVERIKARKNLMIREQLWKSIK